MKFSGKVCLIIILSHKKAVLYPLSGKYSFEKTLSRLYLFTYLFIYLFIYLRIFIQVVDTSYLWSEINDSPIHKYIHIYTLQ